MGRGGQGETPKLTVLRSSGVGDMTAVDSSGGNGIARAIAKHQVTIVIRSGC